MPADGAFQIEYKGFEFVVFLYSHSRLWKQVLSLAWLFRKPHPAIPAPVIHGIDIVLFRLGKVWGRGGRVGCVISRVRFCTVFPGRLRG